jgi:hypothetical protein
MRTLFIFALCMVLGCGEVQTGDKAGSGAEAARGDLEQMQGEWIFTVQQDGKRVPGDTVSFKKDMFVSRFFDHPHRVVLRDTDKPIKKMLFYDPKHPEEFPDHPVRKAIYRFQDGKLEILSSNDVKVEYPVSFRAFVGEDSDLIASLKRWILERPKKD